MQQARLHHLRVQLADCWAGGCRERVVKYLRPTLRGRHADAEVGAAVANRPMSAGEACSHALCFA
jgi:hypothetical protein